MSIPAVLGAWSGSCFEFGEMQIPMKRCRGGAFGSPDVATRDFGKPQTLNNGVCPQSLAMPLLRLCFLHVVLNPSEVVMIRSSERGHFFLDLLLEKACESTRSTSKAHLLSCFAYPDLGGWLDAEH